MEVNELVQQLSMQQNELCSAESVLEQSRSDSSEKNIVTQGKIKFSAARRRGDYVLNN